MPHPGVTAARMMGGSSSPIYFILHIPKSAGQTTAPSHGGELDRHVNRSWILISGYLLCREQTSRPDRWFALHLTPEFVGPKFFGYSNLAGEACFDYDHWVSFFFKRISVGA